jgi:hypothetical protein
MAGQIHPSRQAYVEESHEVRPTFIPPIEMAHHVFTITPTASVMPSAATDDHVGKDGI